MKLLVAALVLFSAHGSGDAQLQSLIRGSLPAALTKIVPGKTTRAQAREILGKPEKSSPESDFYVFEGIRYDTTIGFRDGSVDYIYHRAPAAKLRFDDIKPWVKPNQLSAIQRELNPTHPDHESGREFTVRFPGINLKFANTEEKTLRSVTLNRSTR